MHPFNHKRTCVYYGQFSPTIFLQQNSIPSPTPVQVGWYDHGSDVQAMFRLRFKNGFNTSIGVMVSIPFTGLRGLIGPRPEGGPGTALSRGTCMEIHSRQIGFSDPAFLQSLLRLFNLYELVLAGTSAEKKIMGTLMSQVRAVATLARVSKGFHIKM